jgi:uncharacterized protein (TIRG00374 family)
LTPKTVLRLAAFLVVVAVLAWAASRLDWSELGRRVAAASPGYLCGMLATGLAAMLLRPVRFRFLLNVLGHVQGAGYRTVWAGMVLGAAANSFAPMRAGDVVLAVFLRQRLGVGIHRTFTVIVADWACDFICVVTAFLGALAFAPTVPSWTGHAVVILLSMMVLGIAGLFGVLRWRGRVVLLIDLVLTRLAPRWRARVREIAEEILEGLAEIGHWRTAVPLVLVSAVIWGLIWLSYALGLRAVHEHAAPAAAAFNMAAVTLSFAVPLGPGGLGAFEASSVLALAVFEVPLEPAIAFAVIAHLFQLASVLVMAALAVLTGHIEFRSLWIRADRQ